MIIVLRKARAGHAQAVVAVLAAVDAVFLVPEAQFVRNRFGDQHGLARQIVGADAQHALRRVHRAGMPTQHVQIEGPAQIGLRPAVPPEGQQAGQPARPAHGRIVVQLHIHGRGHHFPAHIGGTGHAHVAGQQKKMVDDAALSERQKTFDQSGIAAVVHHGDVKGDFLRGPAQGEDRLARGARTVEDRNGHVADGRDAGRMALEVLFHIAPLVRSKNGREKASGRQAQAFGQAGPSDQEGVPAALCRPDALLIDAPFPRW